MEHRDHGHWNPLLQAQVVQAKRPWISDLNLGSGYTYIYIYLKQLTSVFLGKGQSIATEVKETAVARRVWCLRPAYANWLNWNVFVHQHLILKCLLNKADCRTDVLVLWCISSNIFSLKKCASPSSVWSHQESAIQNWQIKHHLPDNNLHRTLRYRRFTQSWDKSMEGRSSRPQPLLFSQSSILNDEMNHFNQLVFK